jgi:hypothetical protein
MQLNGPPYQRIGRAMKVSKEAMIGLVTAIESFLSVDHETTALKWDAVVAHWLHTWQAAAPQGVAVTREEINEAGEAIPRIIVRLTRQAPIDRDTFVDQLRAGNPSIEVVLHNPESVAFSPHLLQDNEDTVVEAHIVDVLGQLRQVKTGATVAAH